jgi:thiamine-phosphate diphosphorylase/hydroxyethylthiazole kinase
VLDPVGVGASKFRKATVESELFYPFFYLMRLIDWSDVALLDTWQASVIKGNAGELAALAGTNEV